MYRPDKHLMICFRIRKKAVTPMEAVILSLHFFFQNSFFICFSFVIPFLIMFIFFHSAVYDDIIGCQNLSAINTPIAKAVVKDEDYKEFALYYKVEQAVLDLPVKKNINDEKNYLSIRIL